MSRRLFLKIVEGISTYEADPLPKHFKFFKIRADCTGRMSLSVIMKCTAAIRQLAYGTTPDAFDEYLQMSERTARDCIFNVNMCIIDLYMSKYLRKPTLEDVEKIYNQHLTRHGFPGILGSIDCMHWEWKQCPVSWQGQYGRGDKKYPTIMLEAVASQDLWIWHAFFGVAGANNDINVLDNSPLFDDLLEDKAPVAPFVVKGAGLFGGAISRDTYFISGLAMRRAANAVDLMSLHPQLHDPQSELFLLRLCMGIAKLFFDLRTCQPVYTEEATLFFDKSLCGPIENIVVCGGPLFGDLQWRIASLPIRFGGLGFYSAKSGFLLCFYSLEGPILGATRPHILRDSGIYVDAICPVCRKTCLDSFGEHAVHCKELTEFKYRHDMVRDVFFDICRCAGISANKEAPVNFLTDPSDGRSTLRPADVLVFGWVGGKHACVDLIGVSPLVGLSSRDFTASLL
ncbi:reverse transcriptase domain-containing protein [Tanacetum coccineum]